MVAVTRPVGAPAVGRRGIVVAVPAGLGDDQGADNDDKSAYCDLEALRNPSQVS